MLYTEMIEAEKIRRTNKGENTSYNGLNNIILYGVGKSALVAALSKYVGKDILAIGTAGTAKLFESDYEKFFSFATNSLVEYNLILDGIIKDIERVDKISSAIILKDTIRIDSYKKQLKEKYDFYEKYALDNTYPIFALALEEVTTFAGWIAEQVEEKLGLNAVGEDKRDQGFAWSVFKKEYLKFFNRALRLPILTIICTTAVYPSDKQTQTKITPDICSGKAEKIILENIGNCFYSYKDDNGKFKVQLVENSKVYCKDKLLQPTSKVVLSKEIDTDKNPQAFWEYIYNVNELKK